MINKDQHEMGKRPPTCTRKKYLHSIISPMWKIFAEITREFYLKLLDRNFVTKRELFTYGIAENALCPRCKQNDSIIHTFCNYHWTTSFFSEVIKWFNIENATSFAPSSSELFFDLNNDRKNQSSLEIVKKPYFTLLVAKYYLYINKLAPKDLSLDELKA